MSKTINMVIVEIERASKRTVLFGKPYYYFIDPCSYCNLHCPLCATGARTHQRPPEMLKLKDYEKVLDKIASYAVTVALHNWGEPLLNPELWRMVRITSDRNIGTVVSTNLTTEREHVAEDLIASGLSRLIVSIDGATQETYQKYRRGGNIELVYENLSELIAVKKSAGQTTPVIEWQYLVFKHNEHEIPLAQQLARQLGVDRFICRPVNFAYDHYSQENKSLLDNEADFWMPSNSSYWAMHPAVYNRHGYLWKGACHFLYRGMCIAPNGSVSPCCYDYSNRQDFGNMLTSTLPEVWNSKAYQHSRSLFGRSPVSSIATICETCSLFQKPAVVAEAKTIPIQSLDNNLKEQL